MLYRYDANIQDYISSMACVVRVAEIAMFFIEPVIIPSITSFLEDQSNAS